MPKPVLSDSLFNADDVATAILDNANLAVANSLFTVTDISSSIANTYSNINQALCAYAYNGFVFINISGYNNSPPSNGTTLYTITDSDYYPDKSYYFPTIAYQGDSAMYVEITTSDLLKVVWPRNLGDTTFYVMINGFYRYE